MAMVGRMQLGRQEHSRKVNLQCGALHIPFRVTSSCSGLNHSISVPNLSWAPASRMQQGSLLRSLLGCVVAGEEGGEARLWILSPFLPGMLCVSWRVPFQHDP